MSLPLSVKIINRLYKYFLSTQYFSLLLSAKITMFNRLAIIIVTCITLLSCNQKGKYYNPDYKDTSKRDFYKADSLTLPVDAVETGFNEHDLQLFCNNEMAAYCVLLPLTEFKEDYTDMSVVKAQHKFILKADTANFTSIELQAFTIDKRNYFNTTLFYDRDKRDVAEGGLGIDSTYIDEKNHCYFIKGYLPNYINMRFVQLNWILEDRIAVYFNYDEKDETLWRDRINAIIKRGVKFSD
jgi:hypothetical protein